MFGPAVNGASGSHINKGLQAPGGDPGKPSSRLSGQAFLTPAPRAKSEGASPRSVDPMRVDFPSAPAKHRAGASQLVSATSLMSPSGSSADSPSGAGATPAPALPLLPLTGPLDAGDSRVRLHEIRPSQRQASLASSAKEGKARERHAEEAQVQAQAQAQARAHAQAPGPAEAHVVTLPPAATPGDLQRQQIQETAQRAAEGAQAWAQLTTTFPGDTPLMQFLSRFPRPDRAAVQQMSDLAHWVHGITPAAPPCRLRPEQFGALCQAIDDRVPLFVRQHEGPRILGALRALAEAGVTAERLHMACRWALVRDHLSQLVASVGGYSASFMTYNTLMHHFWGQDNAAATVPVSALTAGSLTMQRLLRMGEMMPGWTRTVARDAQGLPAPHILTPEGFRIVMTQYWGFFPSLAYAAYALDEPRDQILALRNYGFLATGAVAAHRILAFHRDYPWLNADTPRARAAMLQSIDDLCSWQRTFADLRTYVFLRPVAGLAGLAGLDLLQYVEPKPRTGPNSDAAAEAADAESRGPAAQAAHVAHVAHVAQAGRALDGKVARPRNGDEVRPAQLPQDEDRAQPQPQPQPQRRREPDIPPRRPAALCEQLSQSVYRAATFGVPMLVFSLTKQLGAALGLPRQVVSTLHFSLLVPGWGLAMAKGERLVMQDPTIVAENTARSAHQQAVRARRHADAADATGAGRARADRPGDAL